MIILNKYVNYISTEFDALVHTIPWENNFYLLKIEKNRIFTHFLRNCKLITHENDITCINLNVVYARYIYKLDTTRIGSFKKLKCNHCVSLFHFFNEKYWQKHLKTWNISRFGPFKNHQKFTPFINIYMYRINIKEISQKIMNSMKY